MSYDLGSIPLFSGLSDSDLEDLSNSTNDVSLAAGTTLFNEGDVSDMAYVVASGELEITKETAGRPMRLAISGQGDLVGEMGLLTGEARNATAAAITDASLVAIPKAALDDLLQKSVSANQALFQVFISRWRQQESQMRQSERMAQIGVLTAGLAHEMNNPAAAVSAGSEALEAVLSERQSLAIESEPSDRLQPSNARPPEGALARSAAEDEVESVLAEVGVSDPWSLAPTLVDAGFSSSDLSGATPDQIRAAALDAQLEALVSEVREGSNRLSALVAALKSYSFLDQAPVQDYQVVQGLEDTLLILRSKLTGITVERDFPEQVPEIVAFGSQLNQVWTNLIDNAADAINDSKTPNGKIRISVRFEDDEMVVEVENNGPVIPPDVIGRVFEAFFTTKGPGHGTGLGLDTSYNVIVTQHRGHLDVESIEGTTKFTARVPMGQSGD